MELKQSIDDTPERNEEKVTRSISFKNLGIEDRLCKVCSDLKWEEPTKIQQKVIPLILQGKDVIGLAETGSGKTAAFALPILQVLLENPHRFFTALILTPTRELAVQISEQFDALGSVFGIKSAVLVGGLDMDLQKKVIRKKPHIIIGTPGRIVDHLENTKRFHLQNLEFLVMDEADRMLNMNFGADIDKILKIIPQERKTLLFSATMTEKVHKLKRASLQDPVKIKASIKNQLVETLQQYYLFIPAKYKNAYLVHILNELRDNSFIIFCLTCERAKLITLMLRNLSFLAYPLHGKMTQILRLAALTKFRENENSILVSTDLASRGLDIPHVDFVINFDVPTYTKNYIHRVGRTARAGRIGRSITFTTQYDVLLYMRIEQEVIKKKLPLWPTKEVEVMLLMDKVTIAQRMAKASVERDKKEDKKSGKVHKRHHNDDIQSIGLKKRLRGSAKI